MTVSQSVCKFKDSSCYGKVAHASSTQLLRTAYATATHGLRDCYDVNFLRQMTFHFGCNQS